MGKGLLGKKLGMTQIFDDQGNVIPATVIEAGPCLVVQKKTEERDGYQALKLGFQDIAEKRLKKPELGQFKKHDLSPKKYLREIRFDGDQEAEYEIGDQLQVDIFAPGEMVDVTATSRGKGFAGVVKRWGFAGGPATHGSRFHRAPGSIGASADPARVFKGKKMPGRMGGERVTIQNLEVVSADPEQNLLIVKGAVPGPKKGLVVIQEAVKAAR